MSDARLAARVAQRVVDLMQYGFAIERIRPLDFITNTAREVQDRSGKIRLHPSGLYVNPLALRVEDIRVPDIAHHLAGINRYTGATPDPYNVAQHSVIVARYFRHMKWMVRAAALFHDSPEFVLNDIASPVKHNPEYGEAYHRFEAGAIEVIFDAIGIDRALIVSTHKGGQIKAIDDLVFHREAASWWGEIDPRDRIYPVAAAEAERMFMAEYREIMDAKAREETGTRKFWSNR
jgi:Predicted hydrolases of HD superfamily